jgi:hypothetical protein
LPDLFGQPAEPLLLPPLPPPPPEFELPLLMLISSASVAVRHFDRASQGTSTRP